MTAPRPFRPYPAYEPSGVDWLGEIPEGWEAKRVWMLFSLGRGRVINHEEIAENPGDYPVYSSQTDDEGVLGYIKTYDFDGEYLTWTTDGAKAGTVFLREGKFNCTNVCGTLLPKERGIELGFFSYALDGATNWFVRQDINPKLMNNVMAKILVQVPPPAEQRAIAVFLDRETAKIDALVAKKERLIELLEERRTALISRAVTRGLDAKAPLKPSGIPWLGEVPVHWELRKLRHISFSQFSSVDKHKVEGEEAVFLCNYTDVYQNARITPDLDFMEATATITEIEKCGLKASQVLLTKDSESWDDIAVPAFVPSGLEGVLCGYHLAQVTPKAAIIDGEYLFRAFQSQAINYQFRIAATGITRYGFSKYSLDSSLFLIPPLYEQRAIVAFLDRETAKIDALVAKVQEGIEKLTEYRTALISAAVTGKIDVREEVPA